MDAIIPSTGIGITRIAHAIPSWRAISGYFGITEAEEIGILEENPFSVANQRMAFLRTWRSKNYANATYRELARLFREAGLQELARMVLDTVRNQPQRNGSAPADGTPQLPAIKRS